MGNAALCLLACLTLPLQGLQHQMFDDQVVSSPCKVLQKFATHAPPGNFLLGSRSYKAILGSAGAKSLHICSTRSAHGTEEPFRGSCTASSGLSWLLEPESSTSGGACVAYFVIHSAHHARGL